MRGEGGRLWSRVGVAGDQRSTGGKPRGDGAGVSASIWKVAECDCVVDGGAADCAGGGVGLSGDDVAVLGAAESV